MISEFRKKLIVSGIPEDVVNRAYDFVEKSGIGEELVARKLNYVIFSKTLL